MSVTDRRHPDVAAGRAVGCTTILIDPGYDEPATVAPDHTVSSLAEAARCVLALAS